MHNLIIVNILDLPSNVVLQFIDIGSTTNGIKALQLHTCRPWDCETAGSGHFRCCLMQKQVVRSAERGHKCQPFTIVWTVLPASGPFYTETLGPLVYGPRVDLGCLTPR